MHLVVMEESCIYQPTNFQLSTIVRRQSVVRSTLTFSVQRTGYVRNTDRCSSLALQIIMNFVGIAPFGSYITNWYCGAFLFALMFSRMV
jgi:hypothetical protein